VSRTKRFAAELEKIKSGFKSEEGKKVLMLLFLALTPTLLPKKKNLHKMDPSQWIDVTVDKNHYSLDHFVIPKHYEQDLSSILIPHGVIMVRPEIGTWDFI
jgi:hypothetical protein